MSAKLLQALTDENPDLQKQIGCMTGIFQLFDRQHIITSKRLTSHKRPSSGTPRLNSVNVGADSIKCSSQTKEKVLSKNHVENQRSSVESSGASFSSSSCSSFSSLECNKTAQLEPPSFESASLQDLPLKDVHKSQNSEFDNEPENCSQSGHQYLNIRDVVKDAIYREARGLYVNTQNTKEPVNHVSKHRDSPRPPQLCESKDGGISNSGTPKVTTDRNESIRVLAKLKEAPSYFSDSRELGRSCEAKDRSFYSLRKEGPRFSCDGKELSRTSFDSREASKSSGKLRELPRLSLDSRECSVRSSNFNSQSNMNLKNLKADSGEVLGSSKRPTSVVAKLMGLEAMPSSGPVDQEQMGEAKTNPVEDHSTSESARSNSDFSRLSKLSGETKHEWGSRSPKSSLKEPSLTLVRKAGTVVKPVSTSWSPIEPAPWKQQEKGMIPPKNVTRNWEAHSMPPTSQSVYCEIEKRLNDLEFQHSNKDLRALKQILEAMQAKKLLENKKDENQAFEEQVQKNYINQSQMGPAQNLKSANRMNPSSHCTLVAPIKGSNYTRSFESSIVIMKPAKLVERSGVPASSVLPVGVSGLHKLRTTDSINSKRFLINNQTGSESPSKLNGKEPSNRSPSSVEKKTSKKTEGKYSPKPGVRLVQSSSRAQLPPRENTVKSPGSGSLSPRLQHRKQDSERRCGPPMPSSDVNRPRRQSYGQQMEPGSPGGRLKTKSVKKNEQSSEKRSQTDNHSHDGDEVSTRSDSNVSLSSQADMEVTSADLYADTVSSMKLKKSLSSLSEDELLVDFTTVAPEQPSPVSVLDTSFYRDDVLLYSPVKNMSKTLEDNESQSSKEISGQDGWKAVGIDSSRLQPNFRNEMNHKKLVNIELLVQKLRQLNSNHDETNTDPIASLCENTNPDHRYVSEILLASGLLLKDLGSDSTPVQLHSSGHPISPDLFLVLEQTRASRISKGAFASEIAPSLKPNNEKLHRKLLFEAVNELLLRKLWVGQTEPWVWDKLTKVKVSSGQRLLKELCSQMDQLGPNGLEGGSVDDDDDDELRLVLKEDLMSRGESWTDFNKEVPEVVLDIERLIFKDLVDEIVSGEASGLRGKQSRRQRQLFAK